MHTHDCYCRSMDIAIRGSLANTFSMSIKVLPILLIRSIANDIADTFINKKIR